MSANHPMPGRPQPNIPPPDRPQPGYPPQGYPQQGFGQHAMNSVQQSSSQPPKKKGRRTLWIVVSALLVAALTVYLVWNFAPRGPKRPALAEQWSSMISKTPDGKASMLEWRLGPVAKEDLRNRTYYLDLYWYEGKTLNYYSEHPFDSDKSGRLDSNPYLQDLKNVKVTSEHLNAFQTYIDAAPCDKKDFWLARMVLLPDGTPMFTHKCDTGYNTQLPHTYDFTINGTAYTTKVKGEHDELDKILAIASHYDLPFAKLESTGESFRACSGLQATPSYALSSFVNSPMIQPLMRRTSGNDVKPQHYLNFETIDRDKLHAQLDNLLQRGLKPRPNSPLRVEQFDEKTVVIGVVAADGSQGVWLDQDGKEVQR